MEKISPSPQSQPLELSQSVSRSNLFINIDQNSPPFANNISYKRNNSVDDSDLLHKILGHSDENEKNDKYFTPTELFSPFSPTHPPPPVNSPINNTDSPINNTDIINKKHKQ
jgi:hypothetical protein